MTLQTDIDVGLLTGTAGIEPAHSVTPWTSHGLAQGATLAIFHIWLMFPKIDTEFNFHKELGCQLIMTAKINIYLSSVSDDIIITHFRCDK